MLAAAAGQHAPGRREVVVAFQRGKRAVAIVTRIDIEHDQLVGADAEVGLRLIGEPFPDHSLVGRGGEQAARRQAAVGMFRG